MGILCGLWIRGRGLRPILASGTTQSTTLWYSALLPCWASRCRWSSGQQVARGIRGWRMAGKSLAGRIGIQGVGLKDWLEQTHLQGRVGDGGQTLQQESQAPRGTDIHPIFQRDRFPTPLVESQPLRGTSTKGQLSPPPEYYGLCLMASGEPNGGRRDHTVLTGCPGPLCL